MATAYQALEETRQLLREEVASLEGDLREMGEAESAYYSAKAKRALEMQADGYSATVISMVIKGDPKVNQAFFAWKCAEAKAKATQEAINVHKLDARLMEAQISRDWSTAE